MFDMTFQFKLCIFTIRDINFKIELFQIPNVMKKYTYIKILNVYKLYIKYFIISTSIRFYQCANSYIIGKHSTLKLTQTLIFSFYLDPLFKKTDNELE